MGNDIVYTYLKETELNALLNAAGVSSWYGPGFEDRGRLESREDMHRLMTELYRKGALDWEKDTAVITGQAGDLVRIIRDSKICILTGEKDDGSGLTYVYIAGGMTAQIRASNNDEDMLKTAVMPFDDWLDRLKEEGFFPEMIGTAPDLPDTEEGEIRSVMELHDMRTGELMGQLHAEDKGTYGMIHLTSAGRQNTFMCLRDEYERIIRDWTEGRE